MDLTPACRRGPERGSRAWGALAITLILAAAAPPASAQEPPPIDVPKFGQFRSVLAQGEGQSITATDLAANQATGEPPDSFVNQQPLYVGVMPKARSLTPGDLDTYYKDTGFGTMPGGVASVSTPRPGVRIFRDRRFGMAHIYGDTRADLMFGAGYATAQERLFLMDAVRRTAKGTLAGLTGAGSASDDAEQLLDQDFSDEELTAQFDALPSRFGAAGQRTHDDILNYIAGINQRIDEVNANPAEMPAEYPALGAKPERWTVADTAAEAVLLVSQFTVSNGGEEVNAQLQQGFQKRFGRDWSRPYRDLRTANDPEAYTVAKRRHRSDDTGRRRSGLNAIPDAGSIRKRNAIAAGPGAGGQQAAGFGAMPPWVRSVSGLRHALPEVMSNALLVPKRFSKSGRALAAMGPQVSYFSPQIFSEYELHGGGIDVQGVTFPGASPWPLIGHGIDFAWSGTSANGDNQDTFVERLCNPDGSAPSDRSTHYLYRGRCTPFTMRDQEVTTPVSPIDPAPPEKITYRTMRSVHGPVFAFATVDGKPVALTKAKAVDFHELEAAIPFMRLAENAPRSAREFMGVMGPFPGTENWFYVDRDDAAFLQSGRYPRHARGSDVDLPFWGTGKGDWQGFDPATYTFRSIPQRNRPRAVNDPFIISWNNKEAPGWRKGPTEWSNGSVHHAQLLESRLREQMRAGGGKVDLTGVTRAANLAATGDLRGDQDYRWMRRVLGTRTGQEEAMLKLLDSWSRSGSHRLDSNGDNVYEQSAAVALMDAWWPWFVSAAFKPALGSELFKEVEDRVLSLDEFGWDWATHVQKDLRAVLGRRVRGRYSRIYCGGPVPTPVRGGRLAGVRRQCRSVLAATLRAAIAEVGAKQGSADPAQWKVPATCPITRPPSCDQNVPTTAGAVETPPFPWQNRGTFHQVDEILGRR